MCERPLQCVAGMRRSVEPDDDVEPIVDGWRLRRESTRRARWNVVRSTHRRSRSTGRLGNSIPGSRPRAVPIPRQQRRDPHRLGRRPPVRRRRATGHAPPGTHEDARSRHPDRARRSPRALRADRTQVRTDRSRTPSPARRHRDGRHDRPPTARRPPSRQSSRCRQSLFDLHPMAPSRFNSDGSRQR